MTHKMIVDTAKGMARTACEMMVLEKNGGHCLNRRFRRIWLHQNKAMIEAFKLTYGFMPTPEDLYAEAEWTEYVEDARAEMARMLARNDVTKLMKDTIEEALKADRLEDLTAPAARVKNALPPRLSMNPYHPGRVERSLFGDN